MKNLITIIIAFISFTTFAQIDSNAPSKFDKVQITELDTLDLQTEPTPNFNVITSDDNGLLFKIPYNDFIKENPSILKEVDNNSIAIKKYDEVLGDSIVYGNNAINLSFYDNISSSFNVGDYSFLSGYRTEASGYSSTAMGSNTTASGYSSVAIGSKITSSGFGSVAIGYNTTALGNGSVAMGSSTEASGGSSVAMGNNTEASGGSSVAMGSSTEASGGSSVAMGINTSANEYSSLAIGHYSTQGTVETSWQDGSPIFKVGNGVNAQNRNNAYVLYNDGKSLQEGIAQYKTNLHSQYTNRTLVDKEYVDNAITSIPDASIDNITEIPTRSYNDLQDKPTIPSVAGLASETYVDNAVFSGSYNDLIDKPTIPSAITNLRDIPTRSYLDLQDKIPSGSVTLLSVGTDTTDRIWSANDLSKWANDSFIQNSELNSLATKQYVDTAVETYEVVITTGTHSVASVNSDDITVISTIDCSLTIPAAGQSNEGKKITFVSHTGGSSVSEEYISNYGDLIPSGKAINDNIIVIKSIGGTWYQIN